MTLTDPLHVALLLQTVTTLSLKTFSDLQRPELCRGAGQNGRGLMYLTRKSLQPITGEDVDKYLLTLSFLHLG